MRSDFFTSQPDTIFDRRFKTFHVIKRVLPELIYGRVAIQAGLPPGIIKNRGGDFGAVESALRWVMQCNPLTYGVSAIRQAIYLGEPTIGAAGIRGVERPSVLSGPVRR